VPQEAFAFMLQDEAAEEEAEGLLESGTEQPETIPKL
jgi:hypothetical protein